MKLVLTIRRHLEGWGYRLFHLDPSVPVAEGLGGDLRGTESLSSRIFEHIDATNIRGGADRESESLEDLGRRLFNSTFPQAVGDAIRASDSEFLALDLDTESIGIPWELAHDGSDFLCCRFSLGRRIQSWDSPETATRDRPSERSSILIVSNPSGDLPAASQEGESLSNLLETEEGVALTWLNNRTTLKNLRFWLPKSDLLHYCGHSESDDGPSGRPGWRLADGRFTEEEIRKIRADGEQIPLLVFSNSCRSGETVRKDSNGSRGGFAEGFLRQGCPHYVGVHSKVLDRFGSEFAQRFYRHVLNRGAIGTALRLARLEIRSMKESDHLTWAQYVLYGEPGISLFGVRARIPEARTVLHAVGENEDFFEEGLIQELLSTFPDCESIGQPGNVLRLSFPRPSEAVRFALSLHERTRNSQGAPAVRIAIGSGEMLVERQEDTGSILGMTGLPCDIAEAFLGVTKAGQTLTTRSVFDDARSILRGDEIPGVRNVSWLDHGTYRFGEIEEPIGVREIGEEGFAPLCAPADSPRAIRAISPDDEPVLGWRPALQLEIPTAPGWVLTEKLGEGGFGEVWRAKNPKLGLTRVFKFCFRADRVRSLKREVTLFRILKERLGTRRNIVQIHDVYFDEPPYFIAMEDVPGLNLGLWCAHFRDHDRFDESVRLDIVARVADALQAAHDAGVIHRDVKPSNILVIGTPDAPESIGIRLTDFGIGQVQSRQQLVDVTALGFTETYSRTEMTSGSGSRLYMAPELLVGKDSSIRSDIYSLGVVLYQVLLGDCERPLTVDWEREVEDPLLLEDLRQCLAGDASQRFNSAGEVADRLRRLPARREERKVLEKKERTEARRRKWAAVSGAVTALALLISLALGVGLNRAWKAESSERSAREIAERNLYFSQIEEVDRSVDTNPVRAREILYGIDERFRGWEWGNLVLACNMDRACFGGPEGDVVSIELSPDDRFLVTGHRSGVIRVWDVASVELLWEERISGGIPQSLAIDAQSSRLAVSTKTRIGVWEIASRVETESFQSPVGYSGAIRFSPKENSIAASTVEGSLLLYDLSRGTTRTLDSVHPGPINDFVFTPDGSRLLTAGEDSYAHSVDVKSGNVAATVKPGDRGVKSVVVDPNGDWALFLVDLKIRFVSLETLEILPREYQILQRDARGGIDLGPNGERLVLASSEGRVVFLDIESMRNVIERGSLGGPRSVCVSSDDRYAFTIDADRKVRQRFNRELRRGETTMGEGAGFTKSMTFNSDGSLLFTGGLDGSLTVWDSQLGSILSVLKVESAILALDLSPDEKKIGFGTGRGEIHIVEFPSNRLERLFQGHSGEIHDLEFHPDGDRFATTGADRTLRLWSAATGERLGELSDTGGWTLAFSPDGDSLAVQTEDRSVVEFDSETLEPIRTFIGPDIPLRRLIYLPSGDRLAALYESGEIILWSRFSGESAGPINSLVSLVHTLEVDPDGRRLFTSEEIWDLESLRSVSVLPAGHKVISPDGRKVAVERGEGRINILNSFPWKDSELSETEGKKVEERVEDYKREYWSRWESREKEKHEPLENEAEPDSKQVGRLFVRHGEIQTTPGFGINYTNSPDMLGKTSVTCGHASEFGIPALEGGLDEVIRFHGRGSEMGIILHFYGNPLDRWDRMAYTLICDLYYPEESGGKVRAIYDTALTVSTPAELIVSATGGLGVEGQFHGNVKTEKWTRIVCAVDVRDKMTLSKYIDGRFVGEQRLPAAQKESWTIPIADHGPHILLFTGTDSDYAPCYVSSVQLRKYEMTSQEVAELGSLRGVLVSGSKPIEH